MESMNAKQWAAMIAKQASGRISVAAQHGMAGGPFRNLGPGISQLRMIDVIDGSDRIVYETGDLIEAPNWTPDGKALFLNGRGGMFRYDMRAGAGLSAISIKPIEDANNDHVISPDGRTLYISAGGAVYGVPAAGGVPRQLTPEGPISFFLHGVSPDGQWLACTTIDWASEAQHWGIQLVPVNGGEARALLLGTKPVDGPEWSPDGQSIWFNGELDADQPGHSQIYRMNADGTDIRRMVQSAFVDWFPHPNPDGSMVSFLRYPSGTLGHPADLPVEIWTLNCRDGALRRIASFQGGQGSINVNSWSPDGRYLAYVAYPNLSEQEA
jgi:TolB protein